MAPQNTPFGHKDYFKLETSEQNQIQKELSALSSFLLKVGPELPL